MSSGNAGKDADDTWGRLQTLFSRAIELPQPERQAFIDRETAGNAELRTELLELLACDRGSSTGPLTNALGAALDATTRDRRTALLGKVVGNYKLVGVLGHGGAGTVYLAERADRQYSAQVAVKIVDSAAVQGDLGMRFRAERQILASLNHPNIARLLDAGETPDNQPYLVMEYVHGEPLDRYCDRQQLGIHERLQLFLEICSAVQYAHQNLVVHRDLKPANILVTSEGTPKLLDFGIAKLLDAGEAAAALALTRMNERLLTPEYASPEQILGQPVTTASDVYALGVVLYELLTGLRPYTVPASASQLELERLICVSDPQRPSAAVRRIRETGPLEGQSEILAIAAARGLSPEKLQRRLIGDLDAIIMRALRKEPQHRYNSVEQLATDVRCYLTREPVSARQGNWLYYSQRFVRRHAFGVSASAAFIVFVIAFAIVATFQAQRIARERDRAEQENARAETVSEFMLDVFSNADPYGYGETGTPLSAKELLDRAGRRVREDFSQHPEVRARLLESIGATYRRRGNDKEAISFLQDAVHLRKRISGGRGDVATARAMTELAVSVSASGNPTESSRLLEEAALILRNNGQERSTAYARLLANRARIEMAFGKLDSASRFYMQSIALTRELLGSGTKEVAELLLELSNLFVWQDAFQAAERAARESLQIFDAKLPKLHPNRAHAQTALGEALRHQNKVDEAFALLEDSLKSYRLLYGDNNRRVADVLDSLAQIRRHQKLYEEAEQLAQEALTVQINAEGEQHYRTASYRVSLASTLIERNKHAEAEEHLQASLNVFGKTLPSDHQYVAAAEHWLGEVMLHTNRPKEAEAIFTAAMSRWRRTGAPQWREARSASGLGEAFYRQGRATEAEDYLVSSYRVLTADKNADDEARTVARERLVRFYTVRGQNEKLQELLLATRTANAAPDSASEN